MTPERRAAIIDALCADNEAYIMGYSGGDDPDWSKQYRESITEEQIEAYDKWLREFPA